MPYQILAARLLLGSRFSPFESPFSSYLRISSKFSSFKKSGGLEFTAVVIWGLQLQVMNDELFDKDAKLKAKREAVKEAKVANPRDIELVCLKNRYGVSSYSCNFKYYARYDYFLAVNHEPFSDLSSKK